MRCNNEEKSAKLKFLHKKTPEKEAEVNDKVLAAVKTSRPSRRREYFLVGSFCAILGADA